MDAKEREFLEKLGNRIRDLRLEKGWTQMDLGAKSGYDATQIRRVEKGQTNPTVRTLIRIAESLDITVLELFDWEKD